MPRILLSTLPISLSESNVCLFVCFLSCAFCDLDPHDVEYNGLRDSRVTSLHFGHVCVK